MSGSPLDAIAYLKAVVPDDDPAPVLELEEDDSPVFKSFARDVSVAYLVDEGERFSYVQRRHLRALGIDADELHSRATANLAKLADARLMIRQCGPIWALFLDGNFEASLILLDELWDDTLRAYHSGEPIVALPARDVLSFCDASSAAGISELRALIDRVWPDGDHLLSKRLFRRWGQSWVGLDEPS